MKILIFGLNYDPEPTGIAVYTAGLARALVKRGHEVTVVCAPPHYPGWKLFDGYTASRYVEEDDAGVRVVRCPLYIPSDPRAAKRIVHYLSFALSSVVPGVRLARVFKPDLIFAVAPSLLGAPVARLAAAVSGARSWLHVQDFEFEAALATGALDGSGVTAHCAAKLESAILRSFDRVSSISPQMVRKLEEKGVKADRVYQFRNWANTDLVRPSERPSVYRDEWNIRTPHVALYSGSIGNKQGLEIIIKAARLLQERTDLSFVICGEGPNRTRLEALAGGLENVIFKDLQPIERLGELMNLATIHLLPQIDGAADLVLPSKLTNMLGSGRPVIATAAAGTGLFNEIEGCGIATEPGAADSFAGAIGRLIGDHAARATMGRAARERAEQFLAPEAIITHLELAFEALTGNRGSNLGVAA